jgi:hypothetical protein
VIKRPFGALDANEDEDVVAAEAEATDSPVSPKEISLAVEIPPAS